MPKVSVIIPIYNAAPFVERCLASVATQNQKDCEVILVDDGSTDESGELCTTWASHQHNAIVISKTNGGLSDARNVGIEAAKGEYLYFLDADDWIAPNAISTLCDMAQAQNCEVVQSGFFYAHEHLLQVDERWLKASDKPFVLPRTKTMNELIRNNFVKNFAWGKLYQARLVQKHPFPVGKFFEDSFWQHYIIHETTRFGVVPTPLYYYWQRADGISGSLTLRNLDLLQGNEDRLNFVQQYYPQFASLAAEHLWNEAQSLKRLSKSLSPNVALAYADFADHVQSCYADLLSSNFRKTLYYRLTSRNSFLLPLYLLAQRTRNHFFGKSLTLIKTL